MAQWRILRRAPRRPYWIPGGRTSCRPSPGCVCRVWLPLQGERHATTRSVLGALANPCTRACRRHANRSSTPLLQPSSPAPASRTTPTYHPKACVLGGLASRRAEAFPVACHPRRREVETRRRRLRRGGSRDRPLPTPARRGRTIPHPSKNTGESKF